MAKVFPSYTPRYLLLFFLSRTRILSLAVLFNLVFVPFISQIFRNLSKSFSNSLSRPLMSKISNLRSSKIYVQTQIFARWMRFSSRFPNSKKLIRKFSKVSCSHEMDTLPDRKKKGRAPPRHVSIMQIEISGRFTWSLVQLISGHFFPGINVRLTSLWLTVSNLNFEFTGVWDLKRYSVHFYWFTNLVQIRRKFLILRTSS